jgi:tRNA (guanine37-N1)-methyltransferase
MALRIDILAVIPDALTSAITTSIVGKAAQKGVVEVVVHDLHDYATNTFRHIDSPPYGGGAGMIIQCEPMYRCIEKLLQQRTYDNIVFMTPDGSPLRQQTCNQLSLANSLMIICGHYKGIDQRIRDTFVTDEISIGDYVLTGGEIAAGVLVDAIVRLLPGAVGDAESVLEDSFMNGLLDAPHYTKPAVFRGLEVPPVLRSGNHSLIAAWRAQQSLKKTEQRRPDLLSTSEPLPSGAE